MMKRNIKPKNQRVKRALKARAPLVNENPKSVVVVRGQKTSQLINDVLTDIFMLKKPLAKHFKKKNAIMPFEDATSLEFFSRQNDCGLVAFGSHSKKRPNNLILGRFFDHQLLDMIEVGVLAYEGLHTFKGEKPAPGHKPAFIFQGSEWTQTVVMGRLRNLLLDFFRGKEVKKLSVDGLSHVFVCSVAEGRIYVRYYKIIYRRGDGKVPRVSLEECGPRLDLEVRRDRLADSDMFRAACKLPKQARPTKTKNVEKNALGDTMGRIHLNRQKFDKLQTRKMKGLKEARRAAGMVDEDDDQEDEESDDQSYDEEGEESEDGEDAEDVGGGND